MGFRKDAYATVWEINPISDTLTKVRLSIQRKNRDGEFENDFSGFCSCVGTASAHKATMLKERDRIKLGDVDVSNFYDKEKKKEYNNFKIWSFDIVSPLDKPSSPDASVDDGEPNADVEDDGLPF